MAYCFDEAIAYYGEALENEIEIQTEKAKSKKAAEAKARFVMDRWFGKHDTPTGQKKFRSPTATVKK